MELIPIIIIIVCFILYRYDCNGYNSEHDKIYEYSACTDCVYYAEYGYLEEL